MLDICAEYIRNILINQLIPAYCYGCTVDHPSQVQHNVCVMMTWKEQVELLFNDAYDTANIESLYFMIKHDSGHIITDPQCLLKLWQDSFWQQLIRKRIDDW